MKVVGSMPLHYEAVRQKPLLVLPIN